MMMDRVCWRPSSDIVIYEGQSEWPGWRGSYPRDASTPCSGHELKAATGNSEVGRIHRKTHYYLGLDATLLVDGGSCRGKYILVALE